MENNKIKILDDNGNLIEREILFTFECEELGKNYIAYNDANNDMNQVICVASYDPDVELNKLEPITDPEELKMVNDVLNEIIED